ncbi:MAG: ABC transporter permease [Candidatus Omnitrophica bacterium]|nr:ABC transporter permease [Candidatus Omnitrophota bacterium]
MSRYLLFRLRSLIPVFFGITAISFAVMHLAPGKPTDSITDLNVKVSLQAKEQLIKLYGLDRPVHVQYLDWLTRIVRGDFGRSFKDGRPVSAKIAERIPLTLLLNGLALFFILLLSVPLGVVSAAREGSVFDHLVTLFVFIGFALPTFWVALLAVDFFGVKMGWLPVSGLFSLGADRLPLQERIADAARHLVLPVGVIVFGGLAGYSRYVRSGMLEVLQQDYIRTAYAKGLKRSEVLYKHALRNALLPMITVLGLSVPGLISGSVIFESIFALPGMGRLFYEAVMGRDGPVIMGILVIGAGLTLLGNLIADIAYAYADPRIRHGEPAS